VWAPLAARKLLRRNDPCVQGWLTSAEYCCTPMAGRLGPGVTRAQAQAELAILIDQFRTHNRMGRQRPQIVAAGTSWIEGPRKKPQVVPMILTLFVAVTLVLLLACANVGNLLVNAGLVVRGMRRAKALDPGFDVRNATVLSIDLPASQYTGPRTKELTRDLLAQLDQPGDLPAWGLALNPPLSNTNYSTSFQL